MLRASPRTHEYYTENFMSLSMSIHMCMYYVCNFLKNYSAFLLMGKFTVY